MTKYFSDKQIHTLQNADKQVLKNSWDNMTPENQNKFKQIYLNTINKNANQASNLNLQNLKPFEGYNDNQVWIPGVNMVNQNTNNWFLPSQEWQREMQEWQREMQEWQRKIQEWQTVEPKTEIKGLDYVKFKDEPSWNLDLTYDNFQNIYRKQARWERLGISEQNFLSDLKLKRDLEWKSMQEIFWIETKQDKERKLQNLAMENRNLSSGDLRNNLASSGLNYDEIEKVIAYHNPYNEYLQTQNEIKSRSDEAFSRKKEILDMQFKNHLEQIEKNWQNRLNTLNSWLSFSGFGRSSHALQLRDEIAQSVNREIAIARASADAELELYQAQLQGADAETLGALSQNLANYTNALRNQQTENAKLVQALNDQANISMSQALDNMITLTGVAENTVDKELSKELWYLVNNQGIAINVDENWNPIMLLSGRKQNFEEAKYDRDFAYKVWKDDRDFEFKNKEFSHKQNMDNSWLKIDWEKLGLEKDKFNYSQNKDALDYELKLEDIQKAEEKELAEKEQKQRDNLILIRNVAQDTKEIIDLIDEIKWLNQAERQLPWNSAKIDLIKNKLWFENIVRLKQAGVSFGSMTEKEYENAIKAVMSINNTMATENWDNELTRVQNNLKKSILRDFEKTDYNFDFETGYLTEKNSTVLTKDEEDFFKNWWKENGAFREADQTAQTKAVPNKAMNIALNSTRKSGQCGAFVNDYVQKLVWKRIMGDSYSSKQKHINSKIPQIWGLAVWNPGGKFGKYWHTGIVTWISKNYITITDANWNGDEKVMTRKVNIASILNWQNGGFVNFS